MQSKDQLLGLNTYGIINDFQCVIYMEPKFRVGKIEILGTIIDDLILTYLFPPNKYLTLRIPTLTHRDLHDTLQTL